MQSGRDCAPTHGGMHSPGVSARARARIFAAPFSRCEVAREARANFLVSAAMTKRPQPFRGREGRKGRARESARPSSSALALDNRDGSRFSLFGIMETGRSRSRQRSSSLTRSRVAARIIARVSRR